MVVDYLMEHASVAAEFVSSDIVDVEVAAVLQEVVEFVTSYSLPIAVVVPVVALPRVLAES